MFFFLSICPCVVKYRKILKMNIMFLPLEMINEICKYLKWKEIRNLEVAYPFTKMSGAKMDVMKRTLPLLEKIIQMRISSIKELDEEVKQYSNYYFICILLSCYINVDAQHDTIMDMMLYVKSLIYDEIRKLKKAQEEYKNIKSWK